MGLTVKEVDDYFTGPAFLAWWLPFPLGIINVYLVTCLGTEWETSSDGRVLLQRIGTNIRRYCKQKSWTVCDRSEWFRFYPPSLVTCRPTSPESYPTPVYRFCLIGTISRTTQSKSGLSLSLILGFSVAQDKLSRARWPTLYWNRRFIHRRGIIFFSWSVVTWAELVISIGSSTASTTFTIPISSTKWNRNPSLSPMMLLSVDIQIDSLIENQNICLIVEKLFIRV